MQFKFLGNRVQFQRIQTQIQDTREISDVLHDKLNAKFDEVFSALNDASPTRFIPTLSSINFLSKRSNYFGDTKEMCFCGVKGGISDFIGSEVIGISMSSEHLNSSSELRAYLSAFESQMDFDSCLLPATKEKIHNLIAKFDNSWNSYLSSTLLKEDTSPQDICLLASILKLMSSAMLQAIRVLTQGGDSGSLKTSENVALSKEYDLLVATFNVFSSLVYAYQLKGKIFIMEIGVKVGKSEPSLNTSSRDRKSSHAVALKFQKIQTLYLGTRSQTSSKNRAQEQEPGSSEKNHVESALSIEETTGETCNGEIFLRCVLQGSQDSSAVADLADFIECKQGKDYSEWLKDREKFRRWKSEKLENLRWKKRRRAFQKKA
ncbi:hypothetical protein F3Y22_tig00006222pilonHSYRG00010 [Hibiscus syriacus]|uniref:DUF7812 domain-containing protein n=1 Tax=Hibiscus syriacus TaxID=106335 RepID=A0A6A3CDC6_HIBSY|nr:hypothetical protein F3Y22_tig00006222pilonHSYRG00010 [Hibiscus syriacus]